MHCHGPGRADGSSRQVCVQRPRHVGEIGDAIVPAADLDAAALNVPEPDDPAAQGGLAAAGGPAGRGRGLFGDPEG